MINVSHEGYKKKLWKNTLVYLLSNYWQVLKYVKTNPLNIIFDDFGIILWLLGYRTEFSWLYLPQGHTFISTVCPWMYTFKPYETNYNL